MTTKWADMVDSDDEEEEKKVVVKEEKNEAPQKQSYATILAKRSKIKGGTTPPVHLTKGIRIHFESKFGQIHANPVNHYSLEPKITVSLTSKHLWIPLDSLDKKCWSIDKKRLYKDAVTISSDLPMESVFCSNLDLRILRLISITMNGLLCYMFKKNTMIHAAILWHLIKLFHTIMNENKAVTEHVKKFVESIAEDTFPIQRDNLTDILSTTPFNSVLNGDVNEKFIQRLRNEFIKRTKKRCERNKTDPSKFKHYATQTKIVTFWNDLHKHMENNDKKCDSITICQIMHNVMKIDSL